MAVIRQLDRAFTGKGATAQKIARIDRMEAAGSLMLIDPTHPYYSEKAGHFVNGEAIRNIFRDTLASVSGLATGLDGSFHQSIASTPRLNVERTGKGGIHGIVQQNSAIQTTDIYRMVFPQAVADYISSHLSNDYYISLWQRTTRSTTYSTGGLDPTYLTLVGTPAGSSVSAAFRTNGLLTNVTTSGSTAVLPNAEDNHLFTAGLLNAHSAISQTYSSPWITGGFGAWNSSGIGGSGSQGKLPSQIFYRAYVEDLTVSGRTYAEAYVIDSALYTKEVLTAGGRYYGDTFTDPDTVTFPV